MMSFKTKKEERNILLAECVEKYPVLYDYDHPYYSNRLIQDEAWRAIADQFGDAVVNCKENWRSLRNCFARDLRHITTNPNGYTKKKPYYMSEFMQFLVPYLPITQRRNHAILTGNVSPIEPTKFQGKKKRKTTANDSSINDIQDTSVEGAMSVDDSNVLSPELLVQDMTEEEIKTEPDADWYSGGSGASPSDLNEPCGSAATDDSYSRISSSELSSIDRMKNEYGNMLAKGFSNKCNQESDPDIDFLNSLLPDIKKLSSKKKIVFKIKNLELLNELLYENPD